MELPSHVVISLSESDLQKCDEMDLSCQLCSKQFKNLNALRMHKVKTHNEICSEADFRLRHRQQNRKQEVEKRYLCPVPGCSRSKEPEHFIALKLLKQHYMKVHTMKTLSCEICGAVRFSLKRDLKYHQKRFCLQRGMREQGLSSVNKVLDENVAEENMLKVKHVSTQTTVDEGFGHISQDICQPKGTIKDASTNVTAVDLCSYQQGPLPSIDSIPFQSDESFNNGGFFPRRALSSSTQSFNYTVPQNDCAVQSNLLYVPGTRHVETHMDDFDFEEIWRSIETQTSETFGSDALTQTVTDFMDCGIMTDGPYQSWNET